MGIDESPPMLSGLERADKLRVMQILIQELAKEEGALLSGDSYPIWSPYASFEAAGVLLEALSTEQHYV